MHNSNITIASKNYVMKRNKTEINFCIIFVLILYQIKTKIHIKLIKNKLINIIIIISFVLIN